MDSINKTLGAVLDIEDYATVSRLTQVPEGRKHYHPIKSDIDRFELVFGKPPRLIASECERTDEPTVGQAFQLISGPVIQDLLTQTSNRLNAWIGSGKTDAEIAEEMFWTVLSRPASEAERKDFAMHLETANEKRKAAEDLMWALCNSKEFLFHR